MNVATLQLFVAVYAMFAGGLSIGVRMESTKVPVAGFSLILVGLLLLATVLAPGFIQGLLGGQH